jgi:dolichol-phosphate mannosyltransferase
MQLVSVVVPCFNEEEVLPVFFERMTLAAQQWNAEYEVICVDDGSEDGSWKRVCEQSRLDPRWRGLQLARNFGHQAAVTAGLEFASGDAVVIIDADLQDPPEEVSRLIREWRAGFEVVLAIRSKRKDPILKRFLAWNFYRVLTRFSVLPLTPDCGDFCLLDRKVAEVMRELPERNRYLRGLRVWCGFRQTSILYEREARAAGKPQYTFRRSLELALNGLLSFSGAPLRLATHLGLLVSSFAFLGVVFTLAQKIFASQFARLGLAPGPGFPTIVISILFLGGVQLICLGILGEYIGRIYEEVKGRPVWLARDSCGDVRRPVPSQRLCSSTQNSGR